MYKCALEFVTHYSARGIPYRVQEDTSVIPIPQAYLDCCEYIYKTRVDAEAGALTGGSGFFVGAKLEENKDSTQLYVVTAKHVLRGMEHPVLRVNVAEGGVDYLTTDRASWVGHPDGDDLAVCQIEIEYGKYSMRCAFVEDFVDYRKNSLLYPGDEVFMVGRFFSHEGKQQNAPSVRFGNISMLAMETMKTFEDYDQRTFLVEQRSLPGYSGSPVFVFLDPSQPRPPLWMVAINRAGKINLETTGPWLLGVDWVHIQNYEEVLESTAPKKIAVPLRYVKVNTGMAGVIPAWRIADIINSEEFVMYRRKEDQRISEQKRTTSYQS
jgi:hypothetical protein